MNPVETLADLNRACEALERIRNVEGRFEAAKSKADLAALFSDVAEARSAIATVKDVLRKGKRESPGEGVGRVTSPAAGFD